MATKKPHAAASARRAPLGPDQTHMGSLQIQRKLRELEERIAALEAMLLPKPKASERKDHP